MKAAYEGYDLAGFSSIDKAERKSTSSLPLSH